MEKRRKYKDLTGLFFGDWEVIRLDSNVEKTYPVRFICRCKCGSEHSVISGTLTSGKSNGCSKCRGIKQQKVSDDALIECYSRLKSVWKVAKEVGICGQTVYERLSSRGVQVAINVFTDDDKFFLIEHYKNYLLEGKLQQLAVKMGRTKQFICRKAKTLGLTDISRKKSLLANFEPTIKPGYWKNKQHPKGMAGKKHTKEVLEKLSEMSKKSQAKINEDPDKRSTIVKKMIETKHAKGNLVLPRQKTTWKADWREIGGKRKYFRSRWEANYARYLEFLKVQNQISDWEHEPEVFWFEGIKRGCVSYLPDFRVTELNGTFTYHEVKGWMDDRSKTKIKRMAIYHPSVILKIIDAKWFKNNNKTLTAIIYGWET